MSDPQDDREWCDVDPSEVWRLLAGFLSEGDSFGCFFRLGVVIVFLLFVVLLGVVSRCTSISWSFIAWDDDEDWCC